MKAIFVHGVISVDEFNEIKKLGFNTVIHYLNQEPATKTPIQEIIKNSHQANLKIILNTNYQWNNAIPSAKTCQELESIGNIEGYYLFDEPDRMQINVIEQEKKIELWRNFTKKKLFTTLMTDNDQQALSLNFDYYLPDIYYKTSCPNVYFSQNNCELANFRSIGVTASQYNYHYKNKNFMPVVGFFQSETETPSIDQILQQAESLYSFYPNQKEIAIFSWDAQGDVQLNLKSWILSHSFIKEKLKELFNKIDSNQIKFHKTFYIKLNDLNQLISMQYNHKISPNISLKSTYFDSTNSNIQSGRFLIEGIAAQKKGGILHFKINHAQNIFFKGTYNNYGLLNPMELSLGHFDSLKKADFFNKPIILVPGQSFLMYTNPTENIISLKMTPLSSQLNWEYWITEGSFFGWD